MNMAKVMNDRRVLRALLGMCRSEFVALREVFVQALERQSLSKKRQRAPGGGAKGVLDDVDKKLFFVLFYLKVYPTFDVLGALFGKPRGRSCQAIHGYLPALETALGRKCVLPQRRIGSVEEFRQRFPQVKDVMLDGAERPMQRPKSARRNRRHYSGKKKSHRRKNLVMSDTSRRILVLTASKPGRRHDKNLADRSHLVWVIPPEVGVVVDTGFQGVKHPNLFIPEKGTRKRPLSEEQRAQNRYISSQRIVVEHSIGGMKRYGVMSQPLRNKIGRFDDRTALVSAGLWNHHLACSNDPA
jgi:DDE superfamily endonuclease/Helix-turn-helix of DDE superfamily endonuclease